MITKVQASVVTPESNAMTEIPAANNQKTRDARANNCEAINQIRMGLREAGFVSKATLLKMNSPKVESKANFTLAPGTLYPPYLAIHHY